MQVGALKKCLFMLVNFSEADNIKVCPLARLSLRSSVVHSCQQYSVYLPAFSGTH